MKAIDMLSRMALFEDFGLEDLEYIAERCQTRSYRSGESIFYAGDPGHQIYFIGSGKVKIHLERDEGEETVYSIASKGEFFGEMSLLDGQPRSADATCIEESELAYLTGEGLQECLARYPILLRRVMEVMSRRLRTADRQLEMIAALDVYGRVAAQLLELARLHGHPVERGSEIRLSLTQQTLAAMVGASRESVNKVINSYKSRGYIEMDRERIILLDEVELRKRCS
jgi:CRP/FNR family cyclic AMP-dependent transcriptional regulator